MAASLLNNALKGINGVFYLMKHYNFKDEDLVCYCFKYTRKDIENDFRDNGKSFIYAKIALAKKDGGCDCASLNPGGQ